jgi:nucleoid-associated protein YgaU
MPSSLSLRRQFAPSGALAAFFFCTVFFLAAPQLRAQSDDSQSSSQDVAKAARQERARKQQSSKHVYTNEDLRRGKILTPEDQLRAEAKRKPAAPQTTQENAEPLDANSNIPQEPLGDVARRYRNAKKTSPFHLPAQQSELAAPKIPAPIPGLNPNVLPQPQPPARNFSPVRPVTPFPRVTAPLAPSLPSTRAHRVDPFSRRMNQPTLPSISTVRPAEPRTAARPNFSPNIPISRSTLPTPSQSIVVREGDTLWTLSRQHLGRGTRWLELMAANPSIADPTHLVPGTALTLPPRITTHHPKTKTITVQAGDSLSKIALATYGHASAWTCIAHANPTLANPHRLSIGQVLALPSSCIP